MKVTKKIPEKMLSLTIEVSEATLMQLGVVGCASSECLFKEPKVGNGDRCRCVENLPPVKLRAITKIVAATYKAQKAHPEAGPRLKHYEKEVQRRPRNKKGRKC